MERCLDRLVRLSASGRTIDSDARGLLDHQAFARRSLAAGSFCLELIVRAAVK